MQPRKTQHLPLRLLGLNITPYTRFRPEAPCLCMCLGAHVCMQEYQAAFSCLCRPHFLSLSLSLTGSTHSHQRCCKVWIQLTWNENGIYFISVPRSKAALKHGSENEKTHAGGEFFCWRCCSLNTVKGYIPSPHTGAWHFDWHPLAKLCGGDCFQSNVCTQ